MSEVGVTQVEPELVIGMRKRGTYAQIGPMVAKVYKYAAASGAQIQGRPTFICHETPKLMMQANQQGNADVEVAIPVAEAVEGTDEIACYELAGGQMARIVHEGPHDLCAPTYKKLFEWIAQNGKKIVGPTREVYLNDPREVQPDGVRTEIYAPIA